MRALWQRLIVIILAWWRPRIGDRRPTEAPIPNPSPIPPPDQGRGQAPGQRRGQAQNPPPRIPESPATDSPPQVSSNSASLAVPEEASPLEATKPENPPVSATELPTVPPVPRERPVNWLKPKGETPLLRRRKELKDGTAAPRRESSAKRGQVRSRAVAAPLSGQGAGDPEEFGQYYFRDQILDQLDRYFYYLARMKRADRDSYQLLRRVGMQLLPHATTRHFDAWGAGAVVELSPWWRLHRPTFGAVAYGFDDTAKDVEAHTILETADPDDPRYDDRGQQAPDRGRGQAEELDRPEGKVELKLRPFIISKGERSDAKKEDAITGIMWVPRFLYFYKYTKPPADFEVLPGGDIYKLTVYWDRAHGTLAAHRKRKTGVPQDYGVWIGHGTGEVRVLRARMTQSIVIKYPKGPRGGTGGYDKHGPVHLPSHSYWAAADDYLEWSHRDTLGLEPSDYLRRLFIEAAELYASSTMSSVIRVAVSKHAPGGRGGPLTATFGVDIKRTPYFFKDRDVQLTDKGAKKRIFHIVRPFVRSDGTGVPMHFRGLRTFNWGPYAVAISVPGREHLIVPELDIGVHDYAANARLPPGMADMGHLGRAINRMMRDGKGGWR